DADPPRPKTMRWAPDSRADCNISPVPREVAAVPARRFGSSNSIPEAWANSTTASCEPSSAHVASTPTETGPVTCRLCLANPAETAASTVPSPPSATGTQRTSADGSTELSPWVRDSATFLAGADPLNLSGATTMTVERFIVYLLFH